MSIGCIPQQTGLYGHEMILLIITHTCKYAARHFVPLVTLFPVTTGTARKFKEHVRNRQVEFGEN